MQDLYHQPYCYDGHDRHIAVASILTMITVIIDTVINVTVSIVFCYSYYYCVHFPLKVWARAAQG